MFDWLNHLIHKAELAYDRLKWTMRRKLGIGPIKILPYDGYGIPTRLHVRGRVLAGYDVEPATETDSVWENIVNMVTRMRSHEVPRAQVQAKFRDQAVVAQADEEGHFRLTLELPDPISSDKVWHDVELTLVDPPGDIAKPATCRVIVPPDDAEFGVISDLDDTVIQTDVLSVVKAARNTFLHNAYTRLAFPGVASFYQALQHGQQESMNPIFYVSNMPWNLHDLMSDFFRIRHIPRGPMFLTDLGLTDAHFIRRPGREHKLEQIQRILNLYPGLPFILIGDAGEEDPEIYFEALELYPERIKAIYIRDLPGQENKDAIQDLIMEAAELQVDLILATDTLAAAKHAAEHGFITQAAVDNIATEIEQTD